jgi:23S rRNA maturation mini-RNase III
VGDPCKQEGNIGEMQATIEAISLTLHEMRSGQQRFIALLEDIARQGEQIRSIVYRTDKTEKDVEGLFKRMRDAELAPGKQASTAQTYSIMAIISAGIGYLFKKFGG